MPKVIKKKPAKKKPIEESEVKSAALQALEKIKERQKHVIIGVAVIAAVVALFLGVSLYSTSQYKKASSLEREAANYYYGENIDATLPEKDRMEKALELYRSSVDVKTTPVNLFYLGNTFFKMNDYENAIQQYNRFTTKFSSEKAILPLVYQKLASSYFKTGKSEAAMLTLDKLAALDGGIFKDTALLLEARHLESEGEKEESLMKYREIFTQFPASPWAAEANAKVSAVEALEKGAESSTAPKEKPEQPGKPAETEKNPTGQSGSTQDAKKADTASAQ